MKTPQSFTQVEGWSEAFDAAWKRLDDARTDSLFPEIPTMLCGEPVRALTLKDWTILLKSGNPVIAGGSYGMAHALKLVWLLHASRCRFKAGGLVDRALFRAMLKRVLKRTGYDELAVIADVEEFVEDSFLDMPGRNKKSPPLAPTQYPRLSSEISLCTEVMEQFPSFKYEDLRNMPLAQFWQWLTAARRKEDPHYRNDQLTDEVNRKAMDELNRIRQANT